ncbi:MAG: type II toxin-antitoxin system HicB family antitoxin [Clostridia bacterium]|nr:type II toxin-antitoxin system HicB family antitoxin [Clostridia bacterium]
MLYIYPAVVYKENEDQPFVMVLPDVNIVCEGDTIEEALAEARSQLKIYLDCVKSFGANLAKATDFMKFREKYKNEILLLVECEYDQEEGEEFTILF